ncbi:hypothetical protein WJX74_007216 [Apatococcus lobatus]|uniref:Uncharacterized protein n=1 Tax=Apatococcus lobatus TaxID=904363 RepID=A0AAW1RM06_9CHLO
MDPLAASTTVQVFRIILMARWATRAHIVVTAPQDITVIMVMVLQAFLTGMVVTAMAVIPMDMARMALVVTTIALEDPTPPCPTTRMALVVITKALEDPTPPSVRAAAAARAGPPLLGAAHPGITVTGVGIMVMAMATTTVAAPTAQAAAGSQIIPSQSVIDRQPCITRLEQHAALPPECSTKRQFYLYSYENSNVQAALA